MNDVLRKAPSKLSKRSYEQLSIFLKLKFYIKKSDVEEIQNKKK